MLFVCITIDNTYQAIYFLKRQPYSAEEGAEHKNHSNIKSQNAKGQVYACVR